MRKISDQFLRRLNILGVAGALSLSAHVAYADSVVTRTSEFEYDSATGQILVERVEPGNAAACLETIYQPDPYGNRTQTTTKACAGYSGPTVSARTVRNLFEERAEDGAISGPNNSAAGQYETRTINAAGHEVKKDYDIRFGAVARVTDPNDMTADWVFDGFGRVVLEKRPNQTQTRAEYFRCPAGPRCFSFEDTFSSSFASGRLSDDSGNSTSTVLARAITAYYIESTPLDAAGNQNGPKSVVHYDALKREIAKESQSYDGRWVRTITAYDTLGLNAATYSAHFVGETDLAKFRQWAVARDLLHRPTEQKFVAVENQPAVSTFVTYNGLEVATTDPLQNPKTQRKNGAGQLAQTVDAYGATLTFAYDALGNVEKTVDALGNTTTVTYSYPRGFKASMTDPDKGKWTYVHDVFGQLRSQTDARNVTTTLEYDILGRLVSSSGPDQNDNWYFDAYRDGSACNKGRGKLCEAKTDTGFNRKLTYDTYGRPASTAITILGRSFTDSVVYDGNGRVSKITYPTGFSVRRTYNTLGFLARVADWADASRVYWSIDSLGGEFPFDAKGNLLRQRFGDPSDAAGVQTFHDIDRVTGQARELRVGVASGLYGTQHTTYAYDNAGNVTTRNDLANNLQESFAYDRLYRLESQTLNGAVTRTVAMQYNAIGNLLWKSDVGSYLYPASGANVVRPHAVQTAAGVNYAYDAVGNVTSTTGAQSRTHFWNRFGMPLSMAKGSTSMTWTYDPEHKRVSNVVAQGSTTRYVYMVHPDAAGGLFYELELTVSGSTTQVENRHYISATSGVVAVVKTYGENNGAAPSTASGISSTLAAQTQYWHKDALGSVVAVTDARGALIERMAYDAWGKRMYVNGTADGAGALNPPFVGDRGYTGHEHLDELGFIHMNGRVYDPTLGRFLSADPIIGSPDLLQEYNRYTYVRNNPLRFTDPTGECIECFIAIVAIGMIAEGNKYWKTVGQIMLMYAMAEDGGLVESGLGTNTALSCGTPSVFNAGGLGNAFVSAAATGLIASGGDIGTAVQSGMFAMMFYGAGFVGGELDASRFAAHALAGCVQGAMSGGECGPSAMAAVIGHGAGVASRGQAVPVQLTLSTLAGGTAAVLGGGKFANGALTGAFGYLFNSLAHPQNTYEAGVRQAILRGDVAELQALLGNGTLSAQDALIAQRALAAMQSVGAENSAMLAGRYGVDWVNKVGHIFEGVHQGPVGQALLGKFGSPIEAMAQVQRALEVAKPSTGLFSNTFQTTVNVQGVAVQVRGAVVDGVYRIGTILKW